MTNKEINFSDLAPGDRFTITRRVGEPGEYTITGVCVHAPEFVGVETRRTGFLRRERVEIFKAVCIELHPFQGPVPWHPREPKNLVVTVDNSDIT